LVDGVNFLDQVEDIETVERQLKFCHLAVLSKSDLIDQEDLEKVQKKIREINQKVDIVKSDNGNMDYDFLDKDLMEKDWLDSEDTTNSPENKPKTLSLTYEGEVTREKLSEFIDMIKDDSYRIKGFFKLEDGYYQVDVVGRNIDYKLTDKTEEKSELVIISKIGPGIIKPIFNAWEKVIGKEMKLR
jgi:G3E family GTPase